MLPQDLSCHLEGNNTGQLEPTGSLPISLTGFRADGQRIRGMISLSLSLSHCSIIWAVQNYLLQDHPQSYRKTRDDIQAPRGQGLNLTPLCLPSASLRPALVGAPYELIDPIQGSTLVILKRGLFEEQPDPLKSSHLKPAPSQDGGPLVHQNSILSGERLDLGFSSLASMRQTSRKPFLYTVYGGKQT